MSDTSDVGNDMHDDGSNLRAVDPESVMLFVLECIEYYLRYNNILWIPTPNPEYLRQDARYHYFTRDMGLFLVHHSMMPSFLQHARQATFDVDQWLQMDDENAREYLTTQLLRYYFTLPPHAEDFSREYYIFTFAGNLCVRAARSDRQGLIASVVDVLSGIVYASFNVSRYYFILNRTAATYNYVLRIAHGASDDEGHYSDVSTDEDVNEIEFELY